MAFWSVSNDEKKTVEEREIWTHPEHGTIVRRTGYRWAHFLVETNDDKPPVFDYDYVPGGDGVKDSVDMYGAGGTNNIENVDLQSLDDGWYCDVEYPDTMSAEQQTELDELWEQDSYEAWENQGWTVDDTEIWLWGTFSVEQE